MPHPDAATRGPFDVVIAGAGPAGGTLALRLARPGARVALVDRARFPRDKLCGEFLSPECWGVLERLGLAPAVRRLGFHPIRRVRITTPRGRAVEADVSGPDGLPGIGLSRSALDDLIVREARAAGVTVIEEARVIGPVVRDGCVAGVVARRGAGEPIEVLAAVTVAADGRRSTLVQRTGTTRGRHWLRPRMFGLKRHLAVTADGDTEPPGTVGLHLVAGGYVGACRIEPGRANLCGLLPESVLRQHRGDLDRLADDAFPGNPVLGRLWSSARPAGAWKTVAGVRVESSRPSIPGILYVGDCQGTIDPLGGQGMTMALLGAEMLAPFVARALAGARPGAGAPVQAAYDAAWHDRFDRRVRLCRAFHHALVNPLLIDAASTLRTLAPRLLALGFDRTRDPSPGVG
jgi:flavin-dependent dehydrogenase